MTFNGYGMLPADPAAAYSGYQGNVGSPSAYMNVIPEQVLPNAQADTHFQTPNGSIEMAGAVTGAEAEPAQATTAAPGQVPIAIDAGGSGVLQDVQGGGGEEGAIQAFLSPQVEMYYQRSRSWFTRRTNLPVVGAVPNWLLAAGVVVGLMRVAR